MLILYRILTYLLAPFSILFALFTLIMFFVAFTNPPLFLGVFLLAAFIIYFYCTFRFLHNGLLRSQELRPKLRDWIKVNAYVTMPFAILNFVQASMLIRNPALVAESINEAMEMQERMGVTPQPASAYGSMLMTLFYIMMAFSVVLMVHIILTFSFLKKSDHVFVPGEED